MRPDPLLQFNGIGLYPAEDGGVVHVNVAIQQHEFEITVADRKDQIPSDPLALPFHPAAPAGTFGKSRPKDHLGSELPPLERPIPPYLDRLSTSCHATASTRPSWQREDATEPANQLRLWLPSLAYVLMCGLRRIRVGAHPVRHGHLRHDPAELLKIGALVRISVRRVTIAMASACLWQHEVALAHAMLRRAGA